MSPLGFLFTGTVLFSGISSNCVLMSLVDLLILGASGGGGGG